MESLHSKSYALWRLSIFRQLFLPSVSSNSTFVSRRRLHSRSPTSDNHPQPEDIENTDSTSTTNENNNQDNDSGIFESESTTPRPSQLLPQSPLITNPHPGRDRRHRKKRLPTAHDLADLSKNPWAMALASPVRLCSATGARMPKALLTDWGLVEEPAARSNSNSVPDSDSHSDSHSSPSGPSSNNDRTKLWLLPTSLIQDALTDPRTTHSQDKTAAKAPPRPAVKLRMIDRMPVINTITEWVERTRKRKVSPLSMIVPFRWRRPVGPLSRADEARLFWRGDMPQYVLRMMRLEALKRLKCASDGFKRQDVENGVWRSIDVDVDDGKGEGEGASKGVSENALVEGLAKMEPFNRMGEGVVLVLGDGVERSDADVGAALPEFVTLPVLSRKVPVFDLTRLFSQVELEEIRAHHPRFQKLAVFFRPTDRVTVDAVLALWKIQGYLREASV